MVSKDWRRTTRRVTIGVLLAGIGVWPNVGAAVDSSQLWLPRAYHQHSRLLYMAAVVAEHSARCRSVTAGTISADHSERDRPVFKITCRDQNRESLMFLVDGVSLEILQVSPAGWDGVAWPY